MPVFRVVENANQMKRIDRTISLSRGVDGLLQYLLVIPIRFWLKEPVTISKCLQGLITSDINLEDIHFIAMVLKYVDPWMKWDDTVCLKQIDT